MTNSKLNPASEAISMVKAAQTNEEDIPVTPLPDPGEGGPVYDGSMNNDPMDNGSGGNGSFGDDLSSVPVIPCQIQERADLYTMVLITTVHLAVWDSRGIPRYRYTVLSSRLMAPLPFSQVSVSPVTTALPPQALAGYAF